MTAGWEQLLGQPLAQLKQLGASEGAAADVGSDAMEGSPGDVGLRTQAWVGDVTYSGVLNNRPVTLGPDSLLSVLKVQ